MGRCSFLGVGLRAWRGERVLGVEAGELGSGGSSGGGYPFATKTSEAHKRQTLCRHGRTTGCLTISLHTGQCNSCSRLFMLDCWKQTSKEWLSAHGAVEKNRLSILTSWRWLCLGMQHTDAWLHKKTLTWINGTKICRQHKKLSNVNANGID